MSLDLYRNPSLGVRRRSRPLEPCRGEKAQKVKTELQAACEFQEKQQSKLKSAQHAKEKLEARQGKYGAPLNGTIEFY